MYRVGLDGRVPMDHYINLSRYKIQHYNGAYTYPHSWASPQPGMSVRPFGLFYHTPFQPKGHGQKTGTEEQEYKILCEYVLLRNLHYMLVITLHVQLTNSKDYSC